MRVMNRWEVPTRLGGSPLTSASLLSLPAAENRFAKFLMTCLKCCFWCLEKFIKFLNRNAYIMVSRPKREPTQQLLLSGRSPHSHPWALTPPSRLPADCHLRHQLLHLGQERLLPAHEKHHQVRGNTILSSPPSSHCPWLAFTPASHPPLQSGGPRQSYRLPLPLGQTSDRGERG